MMKRILLLLVCISISIATHAQDNCASATALCANNTIAGTTVGATTVGSDPALGCGDLVVQRSVWFSVRAINNGNATITVTNINNNPGLEMEVYTGVCGSLAPIGACASANFPTTSMNVNFAVVGGTTYYIMVDGASGNQEAFNINATTSDAAIIARPDANFIANPTNGCIPLSVLLDSTTTLHGGTNITFQWRIDGGSYLPASGSDTTINLNTLGTHTVDLRVCNLECGCKSVSQDIFVENITTSINFAPAINCLNSTVNFSGGAQMIPDTNVSPNVSSWSWNFGDPNSGPSNTATGQFPSHTFVGPGASFVVQLIVDGTCGPDTTTTVVNMSPSPVVSAGPDFSICEGTTAILIATVISGTLPIASYNWVGPGTIGCTGCDTTTVDDLPAGGPYLFSLDIVDANGCSADTTVNILVNAKPTVDGGTDQTTCVNQPVNLLATPLSGNPPFTYAWDPATGLDDSTLQNPVATVNVFTSYCITITDFTGCVSDAACINIDVYPLPVITPTTPTLCASNPNLTDTFDVTGAGAGSTYSWVLSPDYPLITGAAVDSSSIYVTFPPGIAATYTFIAIVNDGVTGCIDTVPTTFTVTSGLNMMVTGPTHICDGAIATLLASGATTYAWTANPPYAFADSTLASQDVSPTDTTVFTIYGTTGTCMQVITDTLAVNPNPVAITAAIPDFCGCDTVALDGTGSTIGMNYLWTSFGGAVIASPTALSTTSTICSADVFTLTVTNPVSGCSANEFTGANSLPKPDAVADVSPTQVCPQVPTLINLDGTGSDVAVGTTYLWSSSDPSVVISDVTALVTDATVTGTTVFYLTVTDIAGCDSIASDTVFAYTTPLVTAGPDFSICEGTTAILIATVISGTLPIASFNWIGPGTIGCTGCDTTTVDDLPAGGPYLFSLDIVDANGCPDDTTVNITVNAKPTVDGGTDQTTCANQPVNLLATPLSGNPPFTYAWDPATGLDDSTLQNPVATVNVFTSYCITITDFTGCVSDAACINIDVYPTPVITPTIPILCATNPNLTDTFDVTGAGAGSTYSWVLSPDYPLITGAAVDSSSIYVTFPPGIAASYTFISIVTDGITGCIDTVPVNFSVISGLNMMVTGPSQICNGAIATLLVSGALTYAWTANPLYLFADSTQASQDVSPAVTTVFTIYGTAGSCSRIITDTLIVNPNPVSVAVPITGFCGCATVTLNGTGSTPGMNYLWTSGGGAIITSPTALNTNSSICASETFNLTVTDPVTGCFASDAEPANSINKPAAAALAAPVLICPGIANVITLDGTGSDMAGGTTYLWSSSNPSVLIAAPTSLVTSATVYATTIFYLTVTNAAGCDSLASDTVNVFPPPVFSASPAFLCTADPLQQSTLSIAGAGAGSTYSWDVVPACAVPNFASTASQLFDFTVCGVGVYNFTVSVTDGVTGCVDTVMQTVTVVAGVVLVVSNDTSICEGSSVTVSAGGANSFLWNTLDTTSSILLNGLTVAGSPYVFVVTGTVGSCTAVDSVTVTVNPIPVTSPVAGSDTVCENDLGVIYSVTPAIGNYSWSVNGGTISSGQGTDSISVDWGVPGVGTVSVVDTNGFSCGGAPQMLSVTIHPVPVTSPITGPDTVCENTNIFYFVVPNAGSVYSWMATGGSIIGSSTASFVSVIWSPAGSASLSVQETNSVGCSSSGQTLPVEVNPQPLPVVITGNTLLCEGDTMQIYSTTANAGSTYDWVVTGGALVSGQGTDSILVNWGAPGTGIIAATEINTFGCSSDTSYLNVILNAQPVVSATPDSTTVCQSNGLPITGTVNAGIIRWTTTGTGIFNDTTIASPVYTPAAIDSGFYTLMMVVSNPPCFDDTAIVIINVFVNPIVTVNVTQDTICSGTADTLTATGGGSYLWNSSGDTTAVSIVTPLTTAYYSVTVTNAIGCSVSDSILITANPVPMTSPIAGPDSVCEYDTSVVYTVTPQAGNYTWNISGGTIVSGLGTDSIFVNWDSSGVAGIITVVDTNAFGCGGPLQTLNVVINPLPVTPPISGLDTVCENSTHSYFVPAIAGSTYNWLAAGGSIQGTSTDTIVSITWGVSGIGVVTVNETNTLGCTGNAQNMNVVINPVPLPVTVSGNNTLCEGDSMQLYSTMETIGSVYAWSVLGGTLVSGQTTDSIIVNWGAAGSGTIVVWETNLFGCTSDSTFFNVALNLQPIASGYPDSVIVCQTDSLRISGSVNVGLVEWTTSGRGTFNDSTISSPDYYTGALDTGYISLTMVVSNPPCTNDTSVVVVYVSEKPSATIAATQSSVCAGDSTTLSVGAGYSYLWAPGGDTTSSITIFPTVTNTYILTVTNALGCSSTDSILITLIPHGIPTAAGDTLICFGDSSHLTGTFQNAGGLQWSSLGDGQFLPDTNSLVVTYVPGPNDSIAGGMNIVLITTGACFNETDTMHVSINQFPTVYAGKDQDITTGPNSASPVQLNGSASNVIGATWSTSGTGSFTPNNSVLNAMYIASSQDYTGDTIIITLTTNGGCRLISDYMVIDFVMFSIPNVITPYPGSPGVNDFFRIDNLAPNSKLKIWDRWGSLVFVSDYYLNDWDAAELKADTYYYYLLTNGKEYKGWIKVIREN